MALTKEQVKKLRSLAHARKPVVWIGQQGLTANVQTEIETALDHHELIKVKFRVGNRELRDRLIEGLCARTGATSVQRIGNIVALYRKNKDQPGTIFTESNQL